MSDTQRLETLALLLAFSGQVNVKLDRPEPGLVGVWMGASGAPPMPEAEASETVVDALRNFLDELAADESTLRFLREHGGT